MKKQRSGCRYLFVLRRTGLEVFDFRMCYISPLNPFATTAEQISNKTARILSTTTKLRNRRRSTHIKAEQTSREGLARPCWHPAVGRSATWAALRLTLDRHSRPYKQLHDPREKSGSATAESTRRQ